MQILCKYLIDEVFKIRYHVSITLIFCHNKFGLEIKDQILNCKCFL